MGQDNGTALGLIVEEVLQVLAYAVLVLTAGFL
jgi:hypothetical protein